MKSQRRIGTIRNRRVSRSILLLAAWPAAAFAQNITTTLQANSNYTMSGGSYSVTTASSSPITYTGVMSGDGTLEAEGNGTLVLNNINTFTLSTVTETVSEFFVNGNNKQFYSYEGYTTLISPPDGTDTGGFNGPIYTLIDGSSKQPDPPALIIDPGVDVQLGTNTNLQSGGGTVTLGNVTNPNSSGMNLDNIEDNGTLTYQGSNSFASTQIDGQISGSGAVVIQAGILQLYNANTFSGPLLIENNMTGILGSDHIIGSVPDASAIFNNGTFIIDTPYNTPANETMTITQNIYENHFGNDINIDGFGGLVVLAGVNTYTDNSNNGNDPAAQMNPTLSNPQDNFTNELGVIDNRRGINVGISAGTGSSNPAGAVLQLGNGTSTNFFLPGNPLTTYISLEENSVLALDYSNSGPTYVNTIIAGGPSGNSDTQESLGSAGTGTVLFHQGHIVVTQQQYYDGVTQIDSAATLQLGDGTTGDTQTTSGKISDQTSAGDGDIMQSGQTVSVTDTTGQSGHSSTSTGTTACQTINNGTILVDNVKPTLLSNLSGSGQLIQTGADTTTLGPNISYTGATTIDGGTLTLAAGASLASSSGVTLQTLTGSARSALVAAPYSSSNTNFVTVGFPNLDISQSGNQTIASLSGDTTGTVHLGANTLTVNISGASTFNGDLVDGGVGGSLTKSGSGTLILGGANSYTGGTTVSAGLLLIEPTMPSTSALTKGVLTITGGKTQLAADVTLGSGAAASNVNLSSLSITGTGQLDITNNQIIIDYGGSDPMSAIYGYLESGYNNASWNGPGIISSTAQALTNSLSYGVGYADGNDNVVSGLSSGQIELKYTLLGDANLDGVVNGSDFSILAANFGQGVTNWDQGNFLFTSAVNGSDFSALAANFGQGDSGAAVSVSQADIAALGAFAAANNLPSPTITVVPEPACAMIAISAFVLVAARRRLD